MSGKLCKKCGCVVFDQNSEYCDACKSKEVKSEQKKDVIVRDVEHKEFAKNNQWLEPALETISYLVLIVGVIGSFLFAIIDWGNPYELFDMDKFNFWLLLLALFYTILSFISWRVFVVIVRCSLKYLNS